MAEIAEKIKTCVKILQLRIISRRYPIFLDKATYQGARVAIIGPADGVLDEIEQIPVEYYDIVVRMNRSLELNSVNPDKFKRTDVLFHNLKFESGPRSAGTIAPCLLREQGVHLIVFPHSRGGNTSSRFIRLARRMGRESSIRLMMPPPSFYKRLVESLSGHEPTTGTVAMAFFLECNLSSLGLFGFTFFKTGYRQGYNDAANAECNAGEWARQTGIHDPDLEASVILRRILEARSNGMNITLGKGLASALEISENR
jgi:hypothetical protein